MALVLADRVKETTTTAGTGTITLAGAATGFQSFAVIGNSNTTFYTIAAQVGNQWEVGIGTYSNGATGATQTAGPTSGSWTTDGSLVGSNITWYSPSDTGYIVGDYALLFDQTAGSSFFYYGQITQILFAGGFGYSFSANIISSGGTPNGNPSSSWNMQESTGTTLARTTVLSNSSGTQPSALDFSAGPKDVFVTYPSNKSVNLDASGNSTALGTPVSATLTNASGLPISSGVSGLGTGVATALAVNVGTAGAPVVNGGALGTPSSGTASNLTGLPLSTGVTGQLPVANGGTGLATTTAYSVVFSGTTSTGAFQASAGPGTAGQLLTSNGAGALPTFQTNTAASKAYAQAMRILAI